MDLVAASWAARDAHCLLAFLDGGRAIIVLRTPAGRWVACNAFLGSLYATSQEADQRLEKLRKPRRHAYVASLPGDHIDNATPGNLHADLTDGDEDRRSGRRKSPKRWPAMTSSNNKTPAPI
jgi:hypothetical protein